MEILKQTSQEFKFRVQDSKFLVASWDVVATPTWKIFQVQSSKFKVLGQFNNFQVKSNLPLCLNLIPQVTMHRIIRPVRWVVHEKRGPIGMCGRAKYHRSISSNA
jgi:hypothetical protein